MQPPRSLVGEGETEAHREQLLPIRLCSQATVEGRMQSKGGSSLPHAFKQSLSTSTPNSQEELMDQKSGNCRIM